MEETNFVLLWKEQYEKIDQSLAINQKLLREVINGKARSALQSLANSKRFGIIAGIIFLVCQGALLGVAIAHYSPAANYFIGSMGAILIINSKAVFDYIQHITWIKNIDYNDSITVIQEKLTRLRLSMFKHNRLIMLQLPFWTTFYLNGRWFPQQVSWFYIVLQVLVTGTFTWLAYWLYKNQTVANANKKYVRRLMRDAGGDAVTRAMAFYEEIADFQKPI